MSHYWKRKDEEVVHKKESTGTLVTDSSTDNESSEVKRQTACSWTQEQLHFSAEIHSPTIEYALENMKAFHQGQARQECLDDES